METVGDSERQRGKHRDETMTVDCDCYEITQFFVKISIMSTDLRKPFFNLLHKVQELSSGVSESDILTITLCIAHIWISESLHSIPKLGG